MTVVDVNTGKFTGAGGTLEETVTRNNLEAAEEIVRQLRLRDIGGIIVIDFIDMVLESNRDLVLRRLVECLGRDRTRHQVAEVTSLGLVQMTRKRVGQGLIEAFSETCETCGGRGYLVHAEPVEKSGRPTAIEPAVEEPPRLGSRRRGRRATDAGQVPDRAPATTLAQDAAAREAVKATLATIAAAAAHAHEEGGTTAPEVPASGAESSVAALEQADEPEPVIDFDLLRAAPPDGPAGAVEQQGEPAGAVGQGDQGGSVTQSDSVEQGEPGAVPAVPDAGEHGEAPFAAPTAARDAPNDGQPQDARDAAAHL
jgi:ribonuclease E